MVITKKLFELRDENYAAFQSRLTPTVPPESFIGVRVPEVRELAKAYIKDPEHEQFLKELPHTYYDENMLHGLLISEIRDFGTCICELETFLPYVDNWAVCDIMSPKVFRKHRAELLLKIREWAASKETYTVRFGLEMLMTHFLDEDFRPEYMEIAESVCSEEYYVNMMIAWFFATAFAKQWDAAFSVLEERRLSPWVHNKTIQKACESLRITKEQKELLRTMKRNADN